LPSLKELEADLKREPEERKYCGLERNRHRHYRIGAGRVLLTGFVMSEGLGAVTTPGSARIAH
jgi:hypothetical protein